MGCRYNEHTCNSQNFSKLLNNLIVFEVTQKLQLIQLFGGENMLPRKFIHSVFVVLNIEK